MVYDVFLFFNEDLQLNGVLMHYENILLMKVNSIRVCVNFRIIVTFDLIPR